MLIDKQIKDEMNPILLGDNLLHLIGSEFHYHLRQESHGKRIMHQYFMPAYKCRFINEPEGFWWGCEMELPPRKWRQLFKYVKLTLHAPPDHVLLRAVYGRKAGIEYRVWTNKELDWLYPARELKTLGFGTLQFLQVEILHPNYRWNNGSYVGPDGPEAFIQWTEDAISGMSIDAIEKKIQFEEYKRDSTRLVESLAILRNKGRTSNQNAESNQ
jgi:hypothetical protein